MHPSSKTMATVPRKNKIKRLALCFRNEPIEANSFWEFTKVWCNSGDRHPDGLPPINFLVGPHPLSLPRLKPFSGVNDGKKTVRMPMTGNLGSRSSRFG